jgi:hypothetical protein
MQSPKTTTKVDQQKTAINIKIVGIKEYEFQLKEPSPKVSSDFAAENLNFTLGVGFGWLVEKSMFSVILEVDATYEDHKGTQETLLKYKSRFDFEVEDLVKMLLVNPNGSFKLPTPALSTVISIAVSSTRGMIAVRTAGSFMSKYHLPMFNTKELIANATD